MMGDWTMMGDDWATAGKKKCLILGLGGELSAPWDIRATCEAHLSRPV